MDSLDRVDAKRWKEPPDSSSVGRRRQLAPRRLFQDETSSGGGGEIPSWIKGLTIVGALLFFGTFIKRPIQKLVSYLKEKYGTG